ncbi:hypothetical protein BC938DRAFT_477251 [Jimgerdemannia flammicorona]|uniref:Uncharacterized protein n=1 Tax=Jimgerdemannia flammicorona TaxID=994334 RepID=A0A433PB12_9FUNG|nr:hypothetical protein BC938DRAFT_477251 [Jimgerdemannia flammicorona]
MYVHSSCSPSCRREPAPAAAGARVGWGRREWVQRGGVRLSSQLGHVRQGESESDATAPETLLVNLNRAPPKPTSGASAPRTHPLIPPARINLAPTENVLEPSPRPYAETSEGELAEEEEEAESDDSWTSAGIESGKENGGKRGAKKGKAREIAKTAGKAGRTRIRTVTGGVACPCVTPVQMVEVERICGG